MPNDTINVNASSMLYSTSITSSVHKAGHDMLDTGAE
jgi:hypothetical protein